MKTKYYRYTLEGEHSFEEAQRTLGEDTAAGMVVRVDTVGGQTHVYLARQDTGGAKSASTGRKKAVTAGRLKVKEVPESEILKFR
jgi:ribosomal protein S8E